MEQQDSTIAEEPFANNTPADGSPANDKPASNKPSKWLAVVLSFVHPTLGMLYVVQPTAAALYLIIGGMLGKYALADKYSPMALVMVVTWGIRVVAALHAYIAAVQYPADKPRPYYSRGPVAVGLNVVVLLLVLGVNLALYRMAHQG